jgi:hypothetical protein
MRMLHDAGEATNELPEEHKKHTPLLVLCTRQCRRTHSIAGDKKATRACLDQFDGPPLTFLI